jgi:hypothetical protein
MRKRASGLQVGVYIVGGIVGLFLLGFCLVVAGTLSGGHFFGRLPVPILSALGLIYSPLENLLAWIGIL